MNDTKLIDLLEVLDVNENLIIQDTEEMLLISDLTSKKQNRKLIEENWVEREVKKIYIDEYNGSIVNHVMVKDAGGNGI